MKRQQLEKLAEKLGKRLSRTTTTEKAEACQRGERVQWRVHESGWSGGRYFENLTQVGEYLLIELDGQSL